MGEKFCLKWTDFETNVSKSFGILRNEEYLHDVTLVCDDNSQVSAHKLVLSACSEYFKTIFRNNSHPNPLICLEGVSSPELRNILDYMYIGEANIYQENLDNFLSLAQRLKLLGLLQNVQGDSLVEEFTEEQVTKTDQEETAEAYNVKSINSIFKDRKSRYIDRVVSCINGNQQEIDRQVDEHIETYSDGSHKCLLCGKLDIGKGSNGKQNMRGHVETHLEGISYQCQFCEKTFRSRNAYGTHKSRNHKTETDLHTA